MAREIDQEASLLLEECSFLEGIWKEMSLALQAHELTHRTFRISFYKYPKIYEGGKPYQILEGKGVDWLIKTLASVRGKINWHIEVLKDE